MLSLLPALILTPTITLSNGVFAIRDGKASTLVPIKLPARKTVSTFAFKSGGASFKWDEKGLSVTAAGKTRSTKFADLPTSPRFFTPEEIASNSPMDRAAAGLAGWEVAGNSLFLAPRWAAKDKKTWLEVLVRFDLKQASPWFEAVGVMEGASKAYNAVEDRLFLSGSWLNLVSQRLGEWGISRIPLEGGLAEFNSMGEGAAVVDLLPTGQILRFIETTSYNTRIAGVVQLPSCERVNFSETRDPIFFPGEFSDIVQMNSASGVILRNTESGLELKLPTAVGVRNVDPGILVWTPRDAPSQAVLYSKDGLRSIARWKKS
ncbi:MAG: hypothetical protein IT206_05570 [Fimbriimonadaceae bacterium]|nr:hypothetical protein [Fimbriimonadaceae bacterium]